MPQPLPHACMIARSPITATSPSPSRWIRLQSTTCRPPPRIPAADCGADNLHVELLNVAAESLTTIRTKSSKPSVWCLRQEKGIPQVAAFPRRRDVEGHRRFPPRLFQPFGRSERQRLACRNEDHRAGPQITACALTKWRCRECPAPAHVNINPHHEGHL